MRITHIRAKNFRCIRHVDLELRPLTVAIGPNGAGKSTLLELIRFLSGFHRSGNYAAFFSQFGGFPNTLSYHIQNKPMHLGVSHGDGVHRFDYDIELLEERGSFSVNTEELSTQRNADKTVLLERSDTTGFYLRGEPPRKMMAGIDHGQGLLLESCYKGIIEAREIFGRSQPVTMIQVYRFQPHDRVRSPQHLQPTEVPANDGSDLISALYSMQTERLDRFEELMDSIRAAVPEFEELGFPLAGAGHVNLTWKQRDLSRKLYANQLSDGQLRWLWLMTVLHTAPDDGLLLIDEPELSLHPQWLLLLVSMLRKTSARTTLVVATQSAEFVRWVEPEELVIADMTESGTQFSWASEHPNINKWLEDFTLSELWTMGELGGRR